MAKKKVVQPTINEEAGLDASWVPVEQAPIIPNNPASWSGPPGVPNSGSQYYSGPLSPQFQNPATFLATQYRTPSIPSYPLVPPASSGIPSVNSASQSVVQPQFDAVQEQIDEIVSSGVGVEKIVDQTGTFAVTGPTGGVVTLSNNLPFVQSPNNDSFSNDTGLLPQWTQIGVSPNYSYSFGYGRLTFTGNNMGSDNLFGIVEPLSDAFPWLYACQISFQCNYNESPVGGGIIVGNSSTGQYISFGYQSQSELIAAGWNSTTSLNGNVLAYLPGNMGNSCFLGIGCDGTDITFYFSADGVSYANWGVAGLSAFINAIDLVGVGINARTFNATSFQWIRKIQ